MSNDAVERRRSTCFPDPEADDPTDPVEGESRVSWLGRSTTSWATQLRAFYNRNLAALPLPVAERLCRELQVDRSLAKHFELVVGRFLQVLGAIELEYEIEGSEGSRVDWRAQFADGAVSVEATQPLVNAVVGETTRARRAAEAMAIREAPPGWLVWVRHVPAVGPNESLQPLRRVLRASYRSAPAATRGSKFTIDERIEEQRVQITLIGSREPTAPARWGGGGAVAFRDDTSEVVAKAIDGKRRQARGAARPVLIALCTNGWGVSEVEEFDGALLGRLNWSDSGALRFDHIGAFRPVPAGKDPTFAGALIFANLGMLGGPDPILYLHPRFRGTLPAAITGLRQRYARDDGIQEVDGIRTGLVATLGWPEAQ